MALNLKQTFQQKQLMKLSPRQVQLMKLMLVPTLDLERRIKDELQENPALEEGEGGIYADEVPLSRLKEDTEETHANDDDSASDARTDEEAGKEQDFDINDYIDPDRNDYAYRRKSDNYRNPDDEYRAPVRFRQGFREQLNDELGMLALSEHQRRIGEVIIGNLDEDGYLKRSVPAMVNDMAFSLNITATEKEVEEVLWQIQGLDPAGIGAVDLRECLLLQVRRRLGGAEGEGNGLSEEEIRVWKTAERLLEKCFDEFVARQYNRLIEKLKVSEQEVRQAVDAIRTLNPKPGQSGFDTAAQEEVPTLIPDFYLTNDDGVLSLRLHGKNDPNLRVSPAYETMLQAYGTETADASAQVSARAGKKRQTQEAALFVKQKIDSARWFMDMIRQRQSTMLRVMQAVVDFQHDFFLEGDVRHLRPMRLKDIAERVGLDLSTVSRVLNNKYIQTHFGTFPVKKLFSQSLENEEGEEVSTTQIKAALSELIENEDKTNPLSDETLVAALKEKGFSVARRTVAKYREQSGYAVARLRRRI